ncbi:hypothetical protein N9366_04170 [Candidatus Pelagibacter sp.]|nr:hypothetical protein [Candidatus Pelagibacter sp.]
MTMKHLYSEFSSSILSFSSRALDCSSVSFKIGDDPPSSWYIFLAVGALLLDENAILVINKSDLLEDDIDPEIKKLDHVLISIKENLNIDELISKIKNNLKNKFITSDDILITRERHRQHLEQCLDHLKNFNKKNEVEDFDKAAEDLRLATRHLGMIVGKVDVEEILGSIFNDFCIGK